MAAITQVVWFKRDLRVADHAPLAEAALRGPVLPLYIVEPEFWTLHDSSRRHWHFTHDCLEELREDLAALGASLVIRIGDATNVLEELHGELGAFSLWSHEETGNGWTFRRDIAVSAWCRSKGVNWSEIPSNGTVRRLKSRDGWAALREARMRGDLVSLPLPLVSAPPVQSHALPAKDAPMFGAHDIGAVQRGGRKRGLTALNSFLEERARRYMQTISKPGISAQHCSRLSPHITFGTLSVREVDHASHSKMRSLSDNPDPAAQAMLRNLGAFRSRLAWHCHFIQKLEQQPEIEFTCMHPAFEGMREPHFRDDYFEAWKTGRTGYPLIDACMRSLNATGWLNFRMRAMLVSFASYHLWLDWRVTAPVLARLFTDYEPGIHYSQFQMQSGVTGINAVRMYNPIKQSVDHDPEGKFIRRWVPELAEVPNSFIHEPWRMERTVDDYPGPVVEHEASIKRARAELAKRWKGDGFADDTKAVRQKLGSRSPPVTRKKPTTENRQLSFDL